MVTLRYMAKETVMAMVSWMETAKLTVTATLTLIPGVTARAKQSARELQLQSKVVWLPPVSSPPRKIWRRSSLTPKLTSHPEQRAATST